MGSLLELGSKETWALITWLVFAIYLHSRLLKRLARAKAAALGSCGFFVI
jgi:ABC-type transport system involved in cytochrome c biogenesis permease subunit